MSGARALFLDRDGVINVDKGYVHRPDQVEFVDGIFELCASAQQMGFLLIVITNQAGVARGYYSEQTVHELHEWLAERFVERGSRLARFYYCPYHPEHGIGRYKRDSCMRKPKPGMILRARDELGIDLSRSVLIGDKRLDVQAGMAAGVATNIVLGKETSPGAHHFASLREVASWLATQAVAP
jgi:D-glycero-D-manno-heptose 1,7-bisphosphate phosphatase